MPDALDLALANAASNMPKGEELHLENLDSIADPTIDTPQLLPDHRVEQLKQSLQPRNFTEQFQQPLPRPVLDYQQMMEAEYWQRAKEVKQQGGIFDNIGLLEVKVSEMNASLVNLHCKIDSLTYTIQAAAETMPQERNHNHRSLHEWDDTQLLNELVERENDLMPFYYELLKRIGSPELQSLVMSSMHGKNASMVTLAQLCSALAPQPIQPQYPHISEAQRAELKARSELDRIAQEQSQYVPTTIPQQQYFGQATEEYIRQTNNR